MASLVHLVLAALVLCCTCYTCAIANMTPCVCTSRMITRILDKPATTPDVVLIGTMFQHDCKRWRTDPQHRHPGYYAIQHFHQIGYVEADSQVVAKNCTNFSLQPDDRLTTHTTTTTTATTTRATTPSPYVSMCNKMAVFTEIAKGISMGLVTSPKCPDGVHHDADVAVSASCGAPESSRWLRGASVTSNCERLANYIPVAVFDHSASFNRTAGILLKCHNNTLWIATQDCNSGLHIEVISLSSNPRSGDFYVVEW